MALALTRGGAEWTPHYLESIDPEACIGCGRCFKVCGQGVMSPVEKPVEDDEDDEYGGGMVMAVLDPGSCIGCQACARTCAKNAHELITI